MFILFPYIFLPFYIKAVISAHFVVTNEHIVKHYQHQHQADVERRFLGEFSHPKQDIHKVFIHKDGYEQ